METRELLTLPKIEEIPDLGLYMDQVITFMEKRYPAKPLTKTMINNYTKDRILFPPKKKKYSREHLMLLSLIQILKRTLSLPEIKLLLGPLSAAIEKGSVTELYALYESFSAVYPAIIHLGESTQRSAQTLSEDPRTTVLIRALLSAYFADLAEEALTF
ncbi:DUF1836 domain-containing protein [Proteiniclasticum sp. BAD-10]|uniref:DUF1836 domain-containing protein n=1 Tax=Proteiniclasticum sediminis TaxID=2804028 RepID=A0A941CQY0_9CLOT|nr:DUF1836 domain-containing protein [Proteiniclasticum sediminis]MBR0576004.1 DUF1836 domain-containing protein [Proteiniclasticum sediminis]